MTPIEVTVETPIRVAIESANKRAHVHEDPESFRRGIMEAVRVLGLEDVDYNDYYLPLVAKQVERP